MGLSSGTNRVYADQVTSVAERLDCGLVNLFDVLVSGDDDDVDDDDSVSNHYWTDGVHLNALGNALVYEAVANEIKTKFPDVAPMTDGRSKYGKNGIPLEGNLWSELC